MCKLFFYIGLFLSFFNMLAQDELFYKSILNNDFIKKETQAKSIHFETYNNIYYYDVTGNGQNERILPSKKDGADWIEIQNLQGKKLFEGKLQSYGLDSIIYKIKIVKISSDVRVILLFYMDGETNWVHLKRTARVYLLSYDRGQFTYKLFPAAHMAIEHKKNKEQYWQRQMSVESADINMDGIKEIIISYESIQHIFVYSKKDGWKRF